MRGRTPLHRAACAALCLALYMTMLLAPAMAEKLPRPMLKVAADGPSGQPALTWGSIPGTVHYRVYRSGNGADFEHIASVSGTAYTDTNAAVGRTYVYRIRAVAADENDNSPYSEEKGITCALPCPVVRVAQNPQNGRQKLTWTRIEDAREYAIYRAGPGESEYRHVKTTVKTGWTDTDAALGRTYTYRVRALGSQPSLNSALSEAVTGCYELLDTVVLTGETDESGRPALKWNKAAGAVRYRLYRRLGRDGEYALLEQLAKQKATDTDAPPSVACYYKVIAYGEDGERVGASEPVCIETAARAGEHLLKRYVNVPSVDLYKSLHAGHKLLSARYMDAITLWEGSEAEENGRCRVIYGGQALYLDTTDRDENLTREKRSYAYTGQTAIQQEVIDLALTISEDWTTTYAHGQSNGVPDGDGVYGFDCTGLVKYIFTTVMQERIPAYRLYAGIDTLYGMTSICNEGYPGEVKVVRVSRDNLQPGDVLFFTSYADGRTSTEIGHCGIYLGNNEFVHSTSAWEDAVCIIPLEDDYRHNLKAVKRYLPAQIIPADTPVVIDGPYNRYKVYAAKSADAEVIAKPRQGDALTLLYTDNGSWAYVRTQDGAEGFILASHLK